jgi:hypothetical protein
VARWRWSSRAGTLPAPRRSRAAGRLSLDEEGRLVVETLPSTTGSQKLIGVRQWKDRKDEK